MDIPDTEQGIKMFIVYANKQIKQNDLMNKRLRDSIIDAELKLEKMSSCDKK